MTASIDKPSTTPHALPEQLGGEQASERTVPEMTARTLGGNTLAQANDTYDLDVALEIVGDMEQVNTRLSSKHIDRSDLIMTRAIQVPAIEPSNIGNWNDTNNFCVKFVMYESGSSKQPASTEDILNLRRMPKVNSVRDMLSINLKEFPSQYPGSFTHALKPAFVRMLNLFPDPTAALVRNYTLDRERLGTMEAAAVNRDELYKAYCIMSHMIDEHDSEAITDGSDNQKYLWT